MFESLKSRDSKSSSAYSSASLSDVVLSCAYSRWWREKNSNCSNRNACTGDKIVAICSEVIRFRGTCGNVFLSCNSSKDKYLFDKKEMMKLDSKKKVYKKKKKGIEVNNRHVVTV